MVAAVSFYTDLCVYVCAAMSMWLPFQEHLCLKWQNCQLLTVSLIIPCFKQSELGNCHVMCNNFCSVYFSRWLLMWCLCYSYNEQYLNAAVSHRAGRNGACVSLYMQLSLLRLYPQNESGGIHQYKTTSKSSTGGPVIIRKRRSTKAPRVSSACPTIRIFQFHVTLRNRLVVVIIGAGLQISPRQLGIPGEGVVHPWERKPGWTRSWHFCLRGLTSFSIQSQFFIISHSVGQNLKPIHTNRHSHDSVFITETQISLMHVALLSFFHTKRRSAQCFRWQSSGFHGMWKPWKARFESVSSVVEVIPGQTCRRAAIVALMSSLILIIKKEGFAERESVP